MISIQQAGVEILGQGKPRPFYFLFGTEYGIKQKYIEHLSAVYGSCMEIDSLTSFIKSLGKKSLVKQQDSLYVCRYDNEFAKSADTQASNLLKLKIPGCLICVYEDEKQFKKMNKLFPDNVVRVDEVAPNHIFNYVRSDFPKLDARYLNLVVNNCSGGYGQCKIICSQLDSIRDKLHKLEDKQLLSMFGLDKKFTEDQMMVCVAARNFSGVMMVVDSFEDDLNFLINGMCHVSIELDKAMDNASVESKFRPYVKQWTREDVYNFFDQAYNQTLLLRSSTGGNAYGSLVYLASLLKFKRIPSVSEVSWK